MEESKKNKGIGYWLIAIVVLAVLCFASFSIGQKTAKDKTKESSNNSVTESNSNKAEEKTEESNSNKESNKVEESNSNSNVQTSNDNKPNTETKSYKVKDLLGTYESKEAIKKIRFSSKGTYETSLTGPSCGGGAFGNFIIEGSKVYLYPLISSGCSVDEWGQIDSKPEEVTIISSSEIKIGKYTYKKTKDSALNDSMEEGLRYAIKVISEKNNEQ